MYTLYAFKVLIIALIYAFKIPEFCIEYLSNTSRIDFPDIFPSLALTPQSARRRAFPRISDTPRSASCDICTHPKDNYNLYTHKLYTHTCARVQYVYALGGGCNVLKVVAVERPGETDAV